MSLSNTGNLKLTLSINKLIFNQERRRQKVTINSKTLLVKEKLENSDQKPKQRNNKNACPISACANYPLAAVDGHKSRYNSDAKKKKEQGTSSPSAPCIRCLASAS